MFCHLMLSLRERVCVRAFTMFDVAANRYLKPYQKREEEKNKRKKPKEKPFISNIEQKRINNSGGPIQMIVCISNTHFLALMNV